MALNGWIRLWVVASALIGLFVGILTFSNQPSLNSVYESWCSDGVTALIPALEKAEGRSIDHAVLEGELRDKGEKVCTKRLSRIQAKRVDPEVSEAIASINAEHLQHETAFPSTVRNHWFAAIAGWLTACVLLWLVGWSVAWVRRGFSKAAA